MRDFRFHTCIWGSHTEQALVCTAQIHYGPTLVKYYLTKAQHTYFFVKLTAFHSHGLRTTKLVQVEWMRQRLRGVSEMEPYHLNSALLLAIVYYCRE
jgi:hypothetical protein